MIVRLKEFRVRHSHIIVVGFNSMIVRLKERIE